MRNDILLTVSQRWRTFRCYTYMLQFRSQTTHYALTNLIYSWFWMWSVELRPKWGWGGGVGTQICVLGCESASMKRGRGVAREGPQVQKICRVRHWMGVYGMSTRCKILANWAIEYHANGNLWKRGCDCGKYPYIWECPHQHPPAWGSDHHYPSLSWGYTADI